MKEIIKKLRTRKEKTVAVDKILASVREILLNSKKKKLLLACVLKEAKKSHPTVLITDHELFKTAIDIFIGSNKYGISIFLDKDQANIYIYFKESSYILKRKEKNRYDREIEKIAGVKSLNFVSFFSYATILMIISFLMINQKYESYTSYYISIIFFISTIAILSKFDFKIFFILVPIVFIVKYILYNYNYEIFQYYSPSIHFDIHIIFISVMILFFLFSIQGLLILIRIFFHFINLCINSFRLFIEHKKYGYIFFIVIFSIILYFFLKYINFNTYLTIPFVLVFLCIFLTFKLDMKAGQINVELEKKYINFDFLFNFEKIYELLSKNFKGLENISAFSYFKISTNLKIFFGFSICIWFTQICLFYFYLNSFEYHKTFFKENNGYCSNLKYDSLILKIPTYNKVILLTDDIYVGGYLIHFGLSNVDTLPPIDVFRKKHDKNFYYLYEVKCENEY